MNNWKPKQIAITVYHLIAGAIIIFNTTVSKQLMGWDGLYPELNIPLNIVRGLTAGWQEYYGVGLVGGHGFAATLPHSLIIGFLSLAIPQQVVRMVFILLCYYAGGLGMLFVTQKIIKEVFFRTSLIHNAHAWFAGLIASLYYLVNLATIQTFYLPLEAFTVQFATLPWLTYITLLLLEEMTPKRLMLFLIALFVSSIQGFIPSLFIPYILSLVCILLGFIWQQNNSWQSWKKSITILCCVFIANVYWVLPVAYYSLTQSKYTITAYNNIISTQQFAAESIQNGTLPNVALLKGFYLHAYELGGTIMQPWVNHYDNPIVLSFAYGIFGIITIGLLFVIFQKQKTMGKGFAVSLLYFFGNLAIDMPPFSWLREAIFSFSPTLSQAFRTTFTKFSIGLAFFYSIFLALGIIALLRLFPRIKATFIYVIIGLMLLVMSIPVWQGNLIFHKLFVHMPKEYNEAMSTLNALPDGKIADFPQDCAEGWYNDLWGYFGSGFLWYGVNKPFMARAFDVWSPHNENYYWELTTALRHNDYEALEHIFSKYGVRYLLFDQNLTNCKNTKGILPSFDYLEHLSTNPRYKVLHKLSSKEVLPITIIERLNYKDTPQVLPYNTYLNVTPAYQYSDQDDALKLIPYITNFNAPSDYARETASFSKKGEPIPKVSLTSLSLTPIATISSTLWKKIACDSTPTLSLSYSEIEQNEKFTRLLSTNTLNCVSYTVDNLNTSLPYILQTSSRHITGEPLQIAISNKGKQVGFEIPLPTHTSLQDDHFYISPTFPNETSYTITIRNPSYNRYSSMNDIGTLIISSVNIPITNNSHDPLKQPSSQKVSSIQNADHPISGLYILTINSNAANSRDIISIDQGFDDGWIALTVQNNTPLSFITSVLQNKQLKSHILVNNWSNGWEITLYNGDKYIIIFFWPQILEWVGLGLLLVTMIVIFPPLLARFDPARRVGRR